MKKVLRTFFITLVLVLYAGIAGVVYLSQKQPERIQQFLGCPTTSQIEMQKETQDSLNEIENKLNTLLPQVEILFEQEMEANTASEPTVNQPNIPEPQNLNIPPEIPNDENLEENATE